MTINTKDTLSAAIATLFADNSSGDITPADLRSYLTDILDSGEVQRQSSTILFNASISLVESDIDQNKSFELLPGAGVLQTINLPQITPEIVNRSWHAFANYTNGQTADLVAFGGDTLIGATEVHSVPSQIIIKCLDSNTWVCSVIVVDPFDQQREVILAESLAQQIPSGLDAPLQVEFGAAQFGSTDPVQVDASGLFTFNQIGNYLMFVILNFSRSSSVGEAHFFVRQLANGIQIGRPLALIQSDDAISIPIVISQLIGVTVSGTEITIEIVRDSAGINDGQLSGLTSSIGWGSSPSARIRVIQI